MKYLALFVASATFLLNCNNQATAQSFHQATAKAPDAGSMYVHPERISIKGGKLLTVSKGQLFAPLNRNKPDSDIISIEFYKFDRTENADPATYPIFVLQGGPGFPGLGPRLEDRGFFEQRIQPLTEISDVVVVGQRGIGSSTPNTTIQFQMAAQSAYEAHDPEKAATSFQKSLAKERQFWLDQGLDLSGFNVIEAASDVHDIAKGLGYNKITIMGTSFGSHWGITLMRFHPDIVGRAVLSGMEGPDHTWDHPGWIWNVYKRVAKDAEQSEQLKKYIPEGGLVAAAEKLAQQVREQPFEYVVNQGKTSEKTIFIDKYAMNRILRGRGELEEWPSEIIDMANGNLKAASQMTAMAAFGSGRIQRGTASFWMLDSGSGITAKRRAEFEADPAMEIIGSTFWFYSDGSPVWETDLGDEFRSDFETEIPTVIVHGTWDVQTPYENAVELAPMFKDSRFVTVKRGSHGALNESQTEFPEFKEALNQFLASGSLEGIPNELEMPAPTWKVPESKE